MRRSSENGAESTHEILESEEHLLSFLDSMDSYLILMDSLSSALRQGWLELASARHSMGACVSSTLFDLKSHHASTIVQVYDGGPSKELPQFMLRKWASSGDPESFSVADKFEEDELLPYKSISPGRQHQELGKKRPEIGGPPATTDSQAKMERVKSLRVFGMLVSPKLQAAQLSFETALEMLVKISNVRASLLCAYDQVQKDLKVLK